MIINHQGLWNHGKENFAFGLIIWVFCMCLLPKTYDGINFQSRE